MKRSTLVLIIIFTILIIDQASKFWVKTNMHIGEDIPILQLNWAYIHFVENPGMAFGLELGGESGKLFLSLFRICAVAFLIYFIRKLILGKAPLGLLICFALITAGAIGNIIDSAFYGMLFSESPYHSGTAQFLPEEGGYASFLHGRVVDMFYFPIYRGVLPDWIPFYGGRWFEFFKPVFNVADMSISIGVISILLFQRSFFSKGKIKMEEEEENGSNGQDNAPSDTDANAPAQEESLSTDETRKEKG